MEWIALLAIIASLFVIGFLAGIEIAFVSANKLSIELNKKQGRQSGLTWGRFAQHPQRFLGTILVALNIVLVIYGLLVGEMLQPIWNWIATRLPASAKDYIEFIKLFVEIVLATSIILFVEFVSKSFFRARNNSIMKSAILSYIARFFYWVFSSVSMLFVKVAEWVLQYVFNVAIHNKQHVFSKVDLEHLIQQNKNHIEEDSEVNKELFENALSLSDVKLRECLIPRREIESIEQNTPIEIVKEKFISTQLSKLVVYDTNIDNITGYVHQLDMFSHPATLAERLHPIPAVPESMSATDLMNKFSKERKTIAWVIDEFGGTAGIVTMEDLLEEIFGEIKDEYDTVEEFVEKQIAEYEFIFSGRLELDYISEKYKLHFPEDEGSETLSGYIIHTNESIPKQKDKIFAGKFEFDIISVSHTRIETVKVKVLK
ncbi:MAG: hemolysin family protein [Ferruginibacter sp.]